MRLSWLRKSWRNMGRWAQCRKRGRVVVAVPPASPPTFTSCYQDFDGVQSYVLGSLTVSFPAGISYWRLEARSPSTLTSGSGVPGDPDEPNVETEPFLAGVPVVGIESRACWCNAAGTPLSAFTAWTAISEC